MREAGERIDYREERPQPEPWEPATFIEKLLTTLALVALVVAVAASIVVARDIYLLVFGGILLAIFLRMIARPVSKYTALNCQWSLVVVFVAFVVALGGVTWLMGAELAVEMEEILRVAPQGEVAALKYLQQYNWGRFLLRHMPRPEEIVEGTQANLLEQTTNAVFATFDWATNLFIVGFVGIYVALDDRFYRRGLELLIPATQRPRANDVLDKIGRTLEGWLIGRIISMAMVGFCVTVGLWLMGMPAYLALGVIAFVLDFLPVFGPIIAAVPGVLIALTFGPEMAIWVTVLYFAVQMAENFLVIPLISQWTADLPPLILISTQMIFAYWGGLLGMLMASPLAVVAMVAIKRFYVEDTLGERLDEGSHVDIRSPRDPARPSPGECPLEEGERPKK